MSPSVPLVAGAKIPLGFIGLGLVALVGAAALACAQPTVLLRPFLHPHVVAWAHLWLPGFLLSVCMGAVYQLMPVVLGRQLRLPLPLAWIHLTLHAVGVPLLVAAFYTAQYGFAAVGGVLVSVGVLVLCGGVFSTFFGSSRRDAPAWSFPLAAAWLAATVLLGVLMAVNRRSPFLPLSVLSLIKAHAHLGLAGFFLSLLQGTAFQLVPMFTMGTLRRPRFIWAGLLGTQVGLLLLAPGLAWGIDGLVRGGAACLITAIICSGVALAGTFATRRRRKLEPGLKAFAIGAACAALAAVTGGLLVFGPFGGGEVELRVVVSYAVLSIAGVLSFTVLGMLCKIVPFLVWMRAYGPYVGKRPVPLAPMLGSHALERGWLFLHLAALAALLAAVLLQHDVLAIGGSILLGAAVLLFTINVLRVVRHLWRPLEAAPLIPTAASKPCAT